MPWVPTDERPAPGGGGSGTVTHTGGALTDHAVIVGNGTDDVAALASLGTTTTVLHGNAAGDPSFGAVALATDVSGDLPYANLTPATGASKLLLRGSASGGGDWQEGTIGSGLAMTGTVLSSTGGSGTVTHTGALTANKAIIGNGTDDITVSAASGVAHLASGVLTGSNVDLTSEVTGDLPFANLVQASGASKIVGRGSASGAGDFQELSLGPNLSLSGTTLNAVGGGGSGITTKLFDSTLGADTATIDTGAAGIAGGYDVLEIWIIARTDEAAIFSTGLLTFNADTGGNYDRQFLQALHTTASGAATIGAANFPFYVAGATVAANVPTIVRITIPGYAGTTFFKSGEVTNGFAGASTAHAAIALGTLTYRSTAAITRAAIAIATGGAKYKTGTRVIIYGR